MDKNELSILIVDDSVTDRELYKELLLKDRADLFQMYETGTCEETMEFLSGNSVDCILIDYVLPDGNGIQLLKDIRNIKRYKDMPLIFITARGNENIAVDAMKNGASDYLIKGNTYSDLLFQSIQAAIMQKNKVKELREREDRYRGLVEFSPDLMALYHDDRFVYINTAGAYLLGSMKPDDFVGKSIKDLLLGDYRDLIRKTFQKIYDLEEVSAKLEIKISRLNKRIHDIELLVAPVFYMGKQALQIVGRDITGLKKAELTLKELSYTDELTGIPNRRNIMNHLTVQSKVAVRTQLPLSVIMIDIDHFKAYNDTYGHQEGDTCLIEVSHILKNSIYRPGDMVGRYGGEEFIAVLPDTDLPGAETVAEKMRQSIMNIQIPHKSSDVAPIVTISLGVSTNNSENITCADDIILRADRGLYEAKQNGRNRVVTFRN